MFKKVVQLLLSSFIFLSYPLVASYAQSCTPIFPATTCDVTNSVTITATVPDSTATFSGFAPAGSTIIIKENNTVIGSTITDPSGLFSKTVFSTPGLHDFSLSLTDTSGRSTPATTYLGVSLISQTDTPVSNILLAPTIALSKTPITKGETVAVFGQGSPGSTVHLFLNGSDIYSSVVGSGSDWQYSFNSGYVGGDNNLYALLTRPTITDSVNSFDVTLNVGNCRRSDLNCDGRVNLTDFSILLYYWNNASPVADINGDGKVGLIDFSIMMFDWTN